MFSSYYIESGLQPEKVWYDSGRNYIMFLQLSVESSTAQRTAVSVGQVKSKDVPCSDD